MASTESVSLERLAQLPMEVEELRRQVEYLSGRLESLSPSTRFLTVAGFAEAYPEWTEAQVRWILYHRQTNGYGPAVIEGSPLRIDARKFFEILRENGDSRRRRRQRSPTVGEEPCKKKRRARR